jgi:hypothetical protein
MGERRKLKNFHKEQEKETEFWRCGERKRRITQENMDLVKLYGRS